MSETSLSPLSVGLRCRCPRCGRGPLFEKIINVRPACTACGLNFSEISSGGDDPSVFMTLFLGFLMVGGAVWLELSQEPPFWVHLVLWAPLSVVALLVLMPRVKALLIAMKYKHKASEGRLDD